MKRSKNVFLLTSYCNTEEKLNVLSDTIDTIRENFDLEILLHSNRVPLDKKIISSVDYFLYDKRYLIDTGKTIVYWRNFNIPGDIVITMNVNHHGDIGFAVKESIHSSLNYLNSLGFEKAIILNYDTVIEDKGIKLMHEFFKNKITGLLFNRQACQEELNSLMLMLDIKKCSEFFGISLDEYNVHKTYENFLYSRFSDREDVYIMGDWGIEHTSGSLKADPSESGFLVTEFFSIFFYCEDGLLSFVVYDIAKPYFEAQVELKIEDLTVDFFVDEKYNFDWIKIFRSNHLLNDDQKIIMKVDEEEYFFEFIQGKNYLTITQGTS